MNTKRITFWAVFVIVLALIVWGLAVAMKKTANAPTGQNLGSPAPITASDHIRGPVNPQVTIIEYSDFQCPACEAYYPVVTQLLADSTTTIDLVYRHFPLPQHANAMPSAIASEAASVQGKFWEMYDLLFTNHADWTELSDPTPVFVKYATQIGLNVSQFKADLASSTLTDRINANKDEGIGLGIDATPTFFVNGKAIVNPQGYDAFQAVIDAAAKGGTN